MRIFFFTIALAVLLAVPAFSQNLVIGGAAEANITMLYSTVNVNDGDMEDPGTQSDWSFELQLSAENRSKTVGVAGQASTGGFDWLYTWWKPNDLFFISIGAIEESGRWMGAGFTDWDLHSNNFDILRPGYTGIPGYAASSINAYPGNVLPAGTGFFKMEPDSRAYIVPPASYNLPWTRALMLSLQPLYGLTVNLGFPMHVSGIEPEVNYLDGLRAQAIYEIDELGTVALGFANGSPVDPFDGYSDIYLQWNMPILNNITDMNLEIGVNYSLKAYDRNPESPIKAGIGFGFGSWGEDREDDDKVIITARLGASIPMENDESLKIGFDLVFSYDLDIFRLYVPVGLGLNMNKNAPNGMAWNFSPYIAKYMEGPAFFAGIKFFNGSLDEIISDENGGIINWAIPVGLRWEF